MILKLLYIIYSKSAKITLSVCVAVGKFVCDVSSGKPVRSLFVFKSKFNVELRNRFAVLEVEENINEDCTQMEKVYTETAEKVLGSSKEEKQAMVKGGNLESNRPTDR